ncbi:MAG TPA: hypothetical protein VIV61_07165, partial [Candidatus Ozemobacteraceae bacterium]
APRASHPVREEHGHVTTDENDRPRHHHKRDRYDTPEKAGDHPRRARAEERSEQADRPASLFRTRPAEKKKPYGSYRDTRQGKHDRSAEAGAKPSKAPFHADSRRKATDGKAGWASPKSKRPKDR